ncbi:MAG: hypothetical protein JF607_20070 [Burkholderiales bacterium]|nr:hypothetical protein [Burkholderiales bacterium]MBW8893181.1 hypothetical protein [Burkholderiales bacterium]
MAFMVHCGRCRLSPARCDLLRTQWRQGAGGLAADALEQALARLRSLAPDQLACLGLEDDAYARGWLARGAGGMSMALSLQMLEWTTPVPALPPQIWHAMANDAAALALPANLSRRVAAGATLAHWLGTLTGLRMRSPADAHLGRWVSGRTASRLLRNLRLPGADPRHDAIRRTLDGLTVDDWLFVNTVW